VHLPDSSRLATALFVSAAAVTLASPAWAQNEAALRTFFEGKRVTVKIDMPGTSQGVDVFPDAGRPLDYQRYGQKLKEFGTAIQAGDSQTITLIKVKKDLIEFQLGGGGFGTFGDDASSSVYIPTVDKSNREKDLEKRVKTEHDPRTKRELQRELDDLRRDRERENRRVDAEKRDAEERKKERIAEQRLRGGSRFNLRFADGVPGGIKPEEVMAALQEWVDFSSIGGPRGIPPRGFATDTRPNPGPGPSFAADSGPRKGMSRAEAEQQFGKPVELSSKGEWSLRVTTIVFHRGDQRISCDFVDDVLVRYTISSK
jgi:hypothetical protein